MPAKNGHRRNKQSGGSRTGGSAVAALSRSEIWDRQLATRKDSCRVVDRCSVYLLGGTPTAGNLLGPTLVVQPITVTGSAPSAGLLGARVYSIAQCYLQYRINRLLLTYRPVVGTTTPGIAGIAAIDDPDPSTIEGAVLNVGSMEDLRCSHIDSVYRDIEVEWKPIDPTRWYYCDPAQAAPSGSDYRLESPVAITAVGGYLGAPSATTYGLVSLYYDLTFMGATDLPGGVS